MSAKLKLDDVYALSENVVSRDIAGEFIIIPLTSGIGDSDEEVFSLNAHGKAIWQKCDGKRKLEDIINQLNKEFGNRPGQIEKDCLGLMQELLKRKIVVKVGKGSDKSGLALKRIIRA